jgi:putative nucleotidyltransferase with HDIG domain
VDKILDNKILIIENYKEDNCDFKEKLNQLNFKSIICTTPEQALEHIREKQFNIIFYRQKEFNKENIQLVSQIQNLFLEIPIILVSKQISPDHMRLAIRAGSYDFLHEPFELHEIPSLIARNAERKQITRINILKKQSEILMKAIKSLIAAMEAKDEYTSGHSMRVVKYAMMLADKLDLSQEDRFFLQLSAALHDIGKIGMPDEILKKSASLKEIEFVYMKEHPVIGSKIVSEIDDLNEVAAVIKHHHERYDGKGYPDGLKGEVIPLFSRILSIVDAYESLVSDRIYRKSIDMDDAIKVLLHNAGSQFDPNLVELFVEELKKHTLDLTEQKLELFEQKF